MLTKTFMPRMADIIGGRHARHDVVSLWLVEGFIGILEMFNSNVWEAGLIMANQNIDYTGEIVWGKEVVVATGVESIGDSSFVLLQNIYQDSRHCARAHVTLINYDYEALKPGSISQEVRVKLEEHLV